MTDEPSFLTAVRGRPNDRTARLVYADWLDERGDPRGELVRVEAEMRTLPVHADRYWGLKPRRNELRGLYPGVAGGAGLWDGLPADWRGRWRVLREFIERWYRVPMPDVGGRKDEVTGIERWLGRRLSPGVREWVTFGLDLRDCGPVVQVFRDAFSPETITEHNDTSTIVLTRSVDGDWLFGVPIDQLTEPDPPVRLFSVSDDEDQLVGSTTEFAFAIVRGYLRGKESNLHLGMPHDRGWVGLMEEHFLSRRRVGVIEVYEAENVMATLGSWQPLVS